MKKWVFAAGIVFASGISFGDDEVHWAYVGAEGPEHWGELSQKFATCSAGKNQAPINITHVVHGQLAAIDIHYQTGGNEVVNNGHTIMVNYTPGSTITISGHTYELKQFHFHVPSENEIDGKSFPMEGHFVHVDKEGNIAVIGVLFVEGASNAALEQVWAHMPAESGGKQTLPTPIAVSDLLPTQRDYYRFSGSLTTPPCSEGVTWIVMKHPITASKAQFDQFLQVMHHPNNRPVQPINARLVVE